MFHWKNLRYCQKWVQIIFIYLSAWHYTLEKKTKNETEETAQISEKNWAAKKIDKADPNLKTI